LVSESSRSVSVRARVIISLTWCRWNVGRSRAGTSVGQLEVAPKNEPLRALKPRSTATTAWPRGPGPLC
jgi:hypothetical protein